MGPTPFRPPVALRGRGERSDRSRGLREGGRGRGRGRGGRVGVAGSRRVMATGRVSEDDEEEEEDDEVDKVAEEDDEEDDKDEDEDEDEDLNSDDSTNHDNDNNIDIGIHMPDTSHDNTTATNTTKRKTKIPTTTTTTTKSTSSSSRTLTQQPAIPRPLLVRLLHESFSDSVKGKERERECMRIGKEAMSVVEKYMDTFVREALARAVFEKGGGSGGGRNSGGSDDDNDVNGFLEIEDLEKIAPQLLLDF